MTASTKISLKLYFIIKLFIIDSIKLIIKFEYKIKDIIAVGMVSLNKERKQLV